MKLWQGDYIPHIGYPTVIVTTQKRQGSEFPAEFFLWVQELPSLASKFMHMQVGLLESADAVDAGISVDQEAAEEQALEAAKGQLQVWKNDAYQTHHHHLVFKPVEMKEAEDWKKVLLRLRWQGRLKEQTAKAIAETTLSESLGVYLRLLMKMPPIRRGNPNPYQD